MSSEQHSADLLSAWPQNNLGPTFLTSYTFDPFFFEAFLLPQLLGRGAHPIVLFLDAREGYRLVLESAAELSHVGRDYYVAAVSRNRGVFHPKVHYFAHPEVALVGSGNLTSRGCGRNTEVFERLNSETDETAVSEIHEFFVDMIAHDETLLPQSIRDELSHLLPTRTEPKAAGGARFLHSLHFSLIEQLRELVLIEDESELLVAAPFHDANHATTRQLAELLGAKSVALASSRTRHPNPPSFGRHGFLKSDINDGDLHAKVFWAESGASKVSIIGSANATAPAWHGVNVEGIVLRQRTAEMEDQNYFRPMDFFEEGEWTPDLEEDNEGSEELPGPSWQIIGAIADGRRLEVELVGLQSVSQSVVRDDLGEGSIALEVGARGVWQGDLPRRLEGAARIEVVDQQGDSREAIILQLGELRAPPHQRRRNRLLRVLEHDDLTHFDKLELVAWLHELIGPNRGGSTAKQLGGSADPLPPVPDEHVSITESSRAIHSIAEANVPGSASHASGQLVLMLRLADGLTGTRSSRDQRDRTHPGRGEEDDTDSGDVPGSGHDDDQTQGRAGLLGEVDDEIYWLANAILKNPGVEYAEHDRFVEGYECGIRLLSGWLERFRTSEEVMDLSDSDRRRRERRSASLLLSLLQRAWGKPLWGKADPQGAFYEASASVTVPNPEAARTALALTLDVLSEGENETISFPHDRSASVLLGIDEISDDRTRLRPLDQEHPVFRAVGLDELERWIAHLRTNPTPSEKAYAHFVEVRELERVLAQIDSAPAADPSRAELARKSTEILQRLRARDRQLAASWSRLAGKYSKATDTRVGALHDGACPQCHVHQSASTISSLGHKVPYTTCEMCGTIILPGPLDWKHGD